jgi:hypothetical protein
MKKERSAVEGAERARQKVALSTMRAREKSSTPESQKSEFVWRKMPCTARATEWKEKKRSSKSGYYMKVTTTLSALYGG